jgi:hypothetical protein
MSIRSSVLLTFIVLGSLAGCDRLGLPDPAVEASRRDADARATGSACRLAGRGIEDCYSQNPDAARAPVFAGWKEMNDYMRENKMEVVKPMPEKAAASADEHGSAPASASTSASEKTDKKSAAH